MPTRHIVMTHAALALVITLAGCTATDQPLLISQPAAEASDDAAHAVIAALARGDRAALLDLGIPATQADAALATAPDLPDLPHVAFLRDGRVGSRYFRQYVVATASTPALIEVRVWLNQRASGLVEPAGLIVLPRVDRGDPDARPAPDAPPTNP